MTEIVSLTPANMDAFISEARSLLEQNHQKWDQFVGQHKFAVPSVAVPDDTTSEAYKEFQINLWKIVSGRSEYNAAVCEANTNLSYVKGITDTYPFVTRDNSTIQNYFAAVNAIFGKLELPAPADIIEFGVGWGHTTRFLSNCGYNVTAVDIEKSFLDLIPRFSLPGSTEVELVHSDFVSDSFESGRYDLAIFYECFHHCLNHRALVDQLQRILRPGGKVIFCAEPFYDDWFDFPWGLRLDGHSVWAIRNFGWMELGFRKSYMIDLLTNAGFSPEWSSVPGIGAYGEFLVAELLG